MGPRVGDALPNASEERDESAYEDSAATTKPTIERFGEPATKYSTTELQGKLERRKLIRLFCLHMVPS
jgi:hypothetical protein